MTAVATGAGVFVRIRKLNDTTDNTPAPAAQACPPFRSLGELAVEIVADLAFRNRVRLLHARGPRLVAELLAHIAEDRALGTYIDGLLDRYLAISDAALNRTGGRELPPLPLHAVRR